LSPHLATDLPLSLFRLGEWVLAFVLFLALYTREPVEHGTALVVELIGRTSWIIILMVWVALPFFPHLVYGSDETRSLAVLGGVFIIPGIVAFEACVAFYFALFFFRPGLPKWLGCSLALVTLEMTRSRTALVGFLLALVCYAFFYSRKAWLKWAAVGSFLLVGIAIVAFSKPLAEYVARGQSIDDVSTLDGRTAVWQASLDAIQARPLLGYGFVAGAKDAIKDHWIYPHWVPPNAHSELVQALLVGGLPALCLILYIYFFTLRGLLLGASGGREQLILFLIFIQFVIGGVVGGPTLSNVCSSMSGAFLLSCIASAECGRRTPERLQVSAPSFMAASRGRV
jgi:O-antigen ligase